MNLPRANRNGSNNSNNINKGNNIIDNSNNNSGRHLARGASCRRTILGAALALSLPLGLAGTGVARAESLAPTFSTAVGPVDADGNTLGVTLAATSARSAWSLISSDDRFSTFATIVRNAGLVSLFDGTTASTFLAPTNMAFDDAGPEVIAKLSDPDNTGAAASFVKSMVSSSVPSLLDYFRAVSGAVNPTVLTSQQCTADTAIDSNGVTSLTGTTTCTQTTTVVPPAAPIDHLVVLDGTSLHVDVAEVDGASTSGVRLSLGGGFVASAVTVSNGVVDAVDTVNLTHYAA